MAGFMTASTIDVTAATAPAGNQGQEPSRPGRRGRPPKPGRARVNAYLPEALVALLAADAAENGLPVSGRLAEILAAWYSGLSAQEVIQRAF